MRVLALDTTTRDGSAAVLLDDRLVATRRADPLRSHAEQLPELALGAVGDAGLRTDDVDLFAVASGPGSFTGLRIGIATMQGLALVGKKRLAGVSALEALAASVPPEPGALVAAWMDAQRGEVFSALFRQPARTDEDLVVVDGPAVGKPDTTVARWRDWLSSGSVVFAGNGAARYDALIREAVSRAAIRETGPLAPAIARLAARRPGQAGGPAAIRPLYVRRPDAELAREARQNG